MTFVHTELHELMQKQLSAIKVETTKHERPQTLMMYVGGAVPFVLLHDGDPAKGGMIRVSDVTRVYLED